MGLELGGLRRSVRFTLGREVAVEGVDGSFKHKMTIRAALQVTFDFALDRLGEAAL